MDKELHQIIDTIWQLDRITLLTNTVNLKGVKTW